ncbi:uncharacterized protein LOC124286501 [Haliotis rubra]|uniref:uncharacterized protein LOC124286501 n=1 Tax=Haliotis rubra TaxID=36100 RepID=UPI001EE5F2B0|nr:uncharacterized protein LOC124286501 [Haliotis rubra]
MWVHVKVDRINRVTYWSICNFVGYGSRSEASVETGTNRSFSLPPGSDLYTLYDFQVQLLYSGRNVTSTSELFHVNPMDVVIPKAVRGVVVRNTTARTLQLSWQPPDDALTYTFRVTCLVEWDNDEQIHSIQTDLTQTNLSSLSPSTNYTINVQCRERHRQDGYWSYGSVMTVKTLDAVPGRAPRVSPAVSGAVDGRVVLYWQLLSPKEENGEMQGYSVQCEDEGERRVGPGRFSATMDIPTDRRGLWCDVSAVNNVGMSPSSSLYIPSRRSELTLRDFWVAGGEGDTNITFLWDSGGREQHNCTAYWCQTADLTNLCQASVQWETVSCDQRNLTFDTGHVIANQRLMVGFSAQLSAPGGPVWTSIKWDHCVYAQHKVPPAPDGFRLSTSQPPLSVHVEWRPSDCRQNLAHITSYLLSYCPLSGTADRCSGLFRTVQDCSGELCVTFRTVQVSFVSEDRTQDCAGLFRTVQDCSGLFRLALCDLQDCSGELYVTFRTVQDCSGSRGSRVVDSDAVSYLIRNLEPGAHYKVKIRAVSQDLKGPWSAPVKGRVEEGNTFL